MKSFEVRRASGSFAPAEVVGLVPARDTADEAAREALRDALAHHGLVCLRFEDALDQETFRGVAEMFGPIKDPVGRTRDGYELRYDSEMQIIDAGFVLTEEMRRQLAGVSFGGDAERPGLFETFHVRRCSTRRVATSRWENRDGSFDS